MCTEARKEIKLNPPVNFRRLSFALGYTTGSCCQARYVARLNLRKQASRWIKKNTKCYVIVQNDDCTLTCLSKSGHPVADIVGLRVEDLQLFVDNIYNEKR